MLSLQSYVFNGGIVDLSQHRLSMSAYIKDHNE